MDEFWDGRGIGSIGARSTKKPRLCVCGCAASAGTANWSVPALVEVASRGGNFLLNVGPRPDGTIQTEFRERLRSMGNWLAAHGDSIYGTTYGPVQGVDSVRTTSKENQIFVHVFDWPSGALEISGIRARVLSARLLAGGQGLKFTQNDGIFRLDVPAQMPDANVTTFALVTS